MPNYKNRNQRNNSRKSTQSNTSEHSQASATIQRDEDDFGFGSILIKKKTPMSNNTTPTNKKEESVSPKSNEERPDFLEPLSPKPISPKPASPPPPTEWDLLNMTEEDFKAMMQRVRMQQLEDMRKTYQENMLAELKSPRYWLDRIVRLEKEREYFNKKRGWSAGDIMAVERIDAEIKECEEELDIIYENTEELEAACN